MIDASALAVWNAEIQDSIDAYHATRDADYCSADDIFDSPEPCMSYATFGPLCWGHATIYGRVRKRLGITRRQRCRSCGIHLDENGHCWWEEEAAIWAS